MSLQDVEALLRAELADVADGVPSGPAPVPGVVARGRTARRRRRVAGVAGAVAGMVLATLAVSSVDTGALRTEPSPPAATTGLPNDPGDRDRDKGSLPSHAVMAWVAALPKSREPAVVSRDRPGVNTPLDAAGFPRWPSPDGSVYVTLRPAGSGWELQLRDVGDDSVVHHAPANEFAQPLGWVDGAVILFDLGGGPGLWRPGVGAPYRIDGTTDSEEVASIGGSRLLLVAAQGLRSERCHEGQRDARVVEVLGGRDVKQLWAGCGQDSSGQLSPDGRWVVDSRNWFVPVEVSTGRRAPGATGVGTGGVDLKPEYVWDRDGRWLQVDVEILIDGVNVRSFVRCTIADGTCVRLTDPDATQTNSPT